MRCWKHQTCATCPGIEPMKTLPIKARREIDAAVGCLNQCKTMPIAAPHWIQRALAHVTEANQWIVARVLKEQHDARAKRKN